MITLDVEDYCHKCPEFNPEAEQLIADVWCTGAEVVSTVVSCRHKHRCKAIADHIKKEK